MTQTISLELLATVTGGTTPSGDCGDGRGRNDSNAPPAAVTGNGGIVRLGAATSNNVKKKDV